MDAFDQVAQKSINHTQLKQAALDLARTLNAPPEQIAEIETADAVGRVNDPRVTLPQGRLQSLKNGKGWARLGIGVDAVFAARDVAGSGYIANKPGTWTVGESDGFSRKRQTRYNVRKMKFSDVFFIVAHEV